MFHASWFFIFCSTANVKKYKGPGLLPGIAKVLEEARKKDEALSKTFDALKNSPATEDAPSSAAQDALMSDVKEKTNIPKDNDKTVKAEEEVSDEENVSKVDSKSENLRYFIVVTLVTIIMSDKLFFW